MNEANEYMQEMYAAIGIKLIDAESIYSGRTGHERLAREIGAALGDFTPAEQEYIKKSSYSVIYVRACQLRPVLSAKEWIREMEKGDAMRHET